MSSQTQDWITAREAAEILGVHKSAIPKLRRRGELTPRPDGRRPAWSHAEVEALRDHRQSTRPRDPNRRTPPTTPQPPDGEHEWLTTMQVAAQLGLSQTVVNERVRAGTLSSVLQAVGGGFGATCSSVGSRTNLNDATRQDRFDELS